MQTFDPTRSFAPSHRPEDAGHMRIIEMLDHYLAEKEGFRTGLHVEIPEQTT